MTEGFQFDPQLAIAVVSMLAAALWTVTSIRTTTAVLTSEIKHLSSAIERLNSLHDGASKALRLVEQRVALLEQRCDGLPVP